MARGKYQLYSVRHIVELLASYNKILKQLLVGNVLDQEIRHLQLPILALVTCHGAV